MNDCGRGNSCVALRTLGIVNELAEASDSVRSLRRINRAAPRESLESFDRARPAESCQGRKGWRGSYDRRSRGSAAHKTNRDGFTGKANCTGDQERHHANA